MKDVENCNRSLSAEALITVPAAEETNYTGLLLSPAGNDDICGESACKDAITTTIVSRFPQDREFTEVVSEVSVNERLLEIPLLSRSQHEQLESPVLPGADMRKSAYVQEPAPEAALFNTGTNAKQHTQTCNEWVAYDKKAPDAITTTPYTETNCLLKVIVDEVEDSENRSVEKYDIAVASNSPTYTPKMLLLESGQNRLQCVSQELPNNFHFEDKHTANSNDQTATSRTTSFLQMSHEQEGIVQMDGTIVTAETMLPQQQQNFQSETSASNVTGHSTEFNQQPLVELQNDFSREHLVMSEKIPELQSQQQHPFASTIVTKSFTSQEVASLQEEDAYQEQNNQQSLFTAPAAAELSLDDSQQKRSFSVVVTTTTTTTTLTAGAEATFSFVTDNALQTVQTLQHVDDNHNTSTFLACQQDSMEAQKGTLNSATCSYKLPSHVVKEVQPTQFESINNTEVLSEAFDVASSAVSTETNQATEAQQMQNTKPCEVAQESNATLNFNSQKIHVIPQVLDLSQTVTAQLPLVRIPATSNVHILKRKGRFNLLSDSLASIAPVPQVVVTEIAESDITADSPSITIPSEQQEESTTQVPSLIVEQLVTVGEYQQLQREPSPPITQSLQLSQDQFQEALQDQQEAQYASSENSPIAARKAVKTTKKGRFTLIHPGEDESSVSGPTTLAPVSLDVDVVTPGVTNLMTADPPSANQEEMATTTTRAALSASHLLSSVPTMKKKGRFVVTTLTGADLMAAAAQVASAQASAAAVASGLSFPAVVTAQSHVTDAGASMLKELPADFVQTTTSTTPPTPTTVLVMQQDQGEAQNMLSDIDSCQNAVYTTLTATPAVLVTQTQGQKNDRDLSQHTAQTIYTTTPAMFLSSSHMEVSLATDHDNSIQNNKAPENIESQGLMQKPTINEEITHSDPLLPSDSRAQALHSRFIVPRTSSSDSEPLRDVVQMTHINTPAVFLTQSQMKTSDGLANDSTQCDVQTTYTATPGVVVTQAPTPETMCAQNASNNDEQSIKTKTAVKVTPANYFAPQHVIYTDFQQLPQSPATATTGTTTDVNMSPVGSNQNETASVTTPPVGKDLGSQQPESVNGKYMLSNSNFGHQQPHRQRRKNTSKSMSSRGQNTTGQSCMNKALYFIEQVRSEVTDADKLIKSLLTDMQLLKEKNKELEVKLRDAERRFCEEKDMRAVAEQTLKSLKEKMLELGAELQPKDVTKTQIKKRVLNNQPFDFNDIDSVKDELIPRSQSDKSMTLSPMPSNFNERKVGQHFPSNGIDERKRLSLDMLETLPLQPARMLSNTINSLTPPRNIVRENGSQTASPRPGQIGKQSFVNGSTCLPFLPSTQGRIYASERSSRTNSPRVDSAIAPTSKPPLSMRKNLSEGSGRLSVHSFQPSEKPSSPSVGGYESTKASSNFNMLQNQVEFVSTVNQAKNDVKQDESSVTRFTVDDFDPLRTNAQFVPKDTQENTYLVTMSPAQIYMVEQQAAVPRMSLVAGSDHTQHEGVKMQDSSIMTFSPKQESHFVSQITKPKQSMSTEGLTATGVTFRDLQQPMFFLPNCSQTSTTHEQSSDFITFQQAVVEQQNPVSLNWNHIGLQQLQQDWHQQDLFHPQYCKDHSDPDASNNLHQSEHPRSLETHQSKDPFDDFMLNFKNDV